MNLGERIRQIRTERQLSQEGLAELLGISRQAVAKWESGASMPSTAKLLALCDVFHMELTELLGMETGKERTAEPDGGGSREERPGRWRTILPWLLLVAGLICVGLAMGSSCFVPGSDLGIIGGADGPTAILVTSNAAPNFWLWSLLAGLCLGVASGTLGRRLWRRILRRREDKERS